MLQLREENARDDLKGLGGLEWDQDFRFRNLRCQSSCTDR